MSPVATMYKIKIFLHFGEMVVAMVSLINSAIWLGGVV